MQLLILWILSVGAHANDGTPSSLFDAVQQGQDVVLAVSLVSPGEPDARATFRLERDSATVQSNIRFDLEALESEGFSCRVDEGDCELEPERCVDCDGDDILECSGWCEERWTASLRDPCVPPGMHGWSLVQEGQLSGQPDVGLDVRQASGDCFPDPDPVDSDEESGCNSAATSPGWMALALLIGAGLLLRERR